MNVYFDYNATTPLDPRVREAMLPLLGENWGNPSSIHRVGRRARVILDDCRERVARVLGCKPTELIFTSGGTESTNLAILGTARLLKHKGGHLITSAVEHHAVLHACEQLERKEGFELTVLPVDREGRVIPESLVRALRPDTVLVSIMAANNEIGTLQPVAELGAICERHGVCFHTDAVQWFGKEPFTQIGQFHAQLVSLCAHKLHGPKGAGLLFAKSPLKPEPLCFGGGHEHERRAGTENLAAIAGLTAAVEYFVPEPPFSEAKLQPLTERLRAFLEAIPGVRVAGPRNGRLTNTLSFFAEGTDNVALLTNLDLAGVCASGGSACSAGALAPSHVARALGVGDLAKSLVRFSLGRDSTPEEVEHVGRLLPAIIERARGMGQG